MPEFRLLLPKQVGITSSCGPTTYCPGDPVTRGQMAVFLMRGALNQLLPAGTPVIVSVSPTSGTGVALILDIVLKLLGEQPSVAGEALIS